ncbi:DUF6377 domain-containing protein [Alistipes sp. An116]|uniref:DUF6377 domain-containing protein n=1 Tax=Alistipes sp. An116 TaxID=1965546 RepID=UPI001178A319|nr:DUF6377 domain-containing protein [Alistipes sp. An116]
MRTLLLFLASGLAFPLQIWALQPEKVRAELLELDQIIDRQKSFIDLKLGRIQQLEHLIDSKTDNLDQMYNLQSLLADTYFTYQFDSTLYWLRDNLELATRINDPTRINETRLKIANLYTTAGYYLEAANLLDRQIDTAELAGSVLGDYYITRLRFCNAAVEYFTNPEMVLEASASRDYYLARVLDSYPPESETFQKYLIEKLMKEQRYAEAGKVVDRLLADKSPSSHTFAEYAYTKALIEGFLQHADEQICWLARSASADLQSATRDNASLCLLSQILFSSQNDVERAFLYLRVSMADAQFYNARLRPWQIATVLPRIEASYLAQKIRQIRLSTGLGIAALVLFLFACFIAVVEIRRKRRSEELRRELQASNLRMNEYIRELSELYESKTTLNNELRESNAVKEEYIGVFLSICSNNIDRFKEYRNQIRKRLTSGSAKELLRDINSPREIDQLVEEFYNTFDEVFLRLYPNFVEEFNSLLQPEARIEPRNGALNTELRIFALIRLGITDSSKIAALLRYSVNTIYNYRAKVKGNACVSRAEFEECVKKIGSFSGEKHNRSQQPSDK